MEKITSEQIEHIEKLYEEHAIAYNKADHKLAEVKQGSKEKKITRAGEEIRLYDCIEEARILGWESESGKALKEAFPELHELFITQEDIKKEIEDYVHNTLNVNPFQISLLDIIKIARAC